MKKRMTALLAWAAALALLVGGSALAEGGGAEEPGRYRLEQVVMLSRHNLRAPLRGTSADLPELTPHAWTEWTVPYSELTLKGGVAETLMGEYFRKWLEAEELIPEHYVPGKREVRFYANARQRTIATARYFAAGCLPLADVTVHHKSKLGASDPTFLLVYTFMSDAYREAVLEQLDEKYGYREDGELWERLAEDYALLSDVLDFEASDGFLSGNYAPWVADDIKVNCKEGKETSVKGSIHMASAAGNALLLQYYEVADDREAAFGHELTLEDWEKIADIGTVCQSLRYRLPLIGINVAHPMLQRLLKEMQTDGRKLSYICGHDSNLATVLSALGVTDYELPDTIEKKTPIGCKLLFETWSSEDGEYARVRLVYQSTEQLRNLTPLSLDDPPASYDVELPGLERNADGYYRLEDVYGCLQDAIDAYDEMVEKYSDDEPEADAA